MAAINRVGWITAKPYPPLEASCPWITLPIAAMGRSYMKRIFL
ncbi:hypothetical protein ACN429_07360 [Pseudomonas oryzihabitans]